MAKRTHVPCTPANCGDLFPRCGSHRAYANLKCRCEVCYQGNAERGRQWRQANPDKISKWNKEYREVHRETLVEYNRQYREANPEKCAAGEKRYREANPEKISKRRKRYYEAKRGTILEKQRRYNAENSAACVERARQWALDNPENYREIQRRGQQVRRARIKNATVVKFTPEQERQKMAYYGNSCYLKLPGLCTGGFDVIEHVKPLAKDGPHMIANLRPACKPCNRRKWDHWPFEFAA